MSSISLVNPSIRCMNGGYSEDKYENQSRNNFADKDVYETHWREVLWRSPSWTSSPSPIQQEITSLIWGVFDEIFLSHIPRKD